jgi:predicted amidohydrolase YtcJ
MKKTFLLASILGMAALSCSNVDKADLILMNAEVYTMEEDQPWASAIVIKENKIIAVLDNDRSSGKYVGPDTRLVNLEGKFVLPGFIDGHTHFDGTGSQLNDANLLAVADEEGLRKEITRVVDILEDGEWITRGLWGAYEKWTLGASSAGAGAGSDERWMPDRRMIDDLTPSNPCLLRSFDGRWFLANTLALEISGVDHMYPEDMVRDERGRLTGLIHKGSPRIMDIQKVIQHKSHERLLDENRAALKYLRECGIVEIHDITGPQQTKRYMELENDGELTCRIWMRPDLSRGAEMKEMGMIPGSHPGTGKPSRLLRYGALKGYIDGIMGTHGALFFEPYDDQPDNYGHYRRHTSEDPDFRTGNMDKMYSLIKTGYDAGFVSNVHAIGTKGVSLMLDTYERLMTDLGRDLEGFRVIHAQVIRPEDFSRFKQLNVIAEVNPYHVSDDMRWMEERIGHERCKGAYAFRSLLDNGAILSFGSDMPGTSAAEYFAHPKFLIHAAVNRTTLNGEPEGGWFPEEKITMEEALKAYTINNAYAAFDADIRGSIKPGKLADITVCDLNLMKIPPEDILKMNIEMTIVDGKIVYEGAGN